MVAELVIEVPKILPHDVPLRRWCRDTQLVEQLVEVPTTVSYSSLQRTVEQHVDIPVPGGGGGPSSGLQGFSSGQRSTASPSKKPPLVHILDAPVPQMVDQLLDIEQSRAGYRRTQDPAFRCLYAHGRARSAAGGTAGGSTDDYFLFLVTTDCGAARRPISGLQGFSSGQSSTATLSSKKRISERIVEQIVDPVSSGRLLGSLPGQGSSSSHSPAGDEERADELGKGVFALFPKKKSAKLAPHSGSELLPESSPSTRAPQLEDSVEWVRLRDDNSGKPYYWNRRTRATVWKAPAGVKVVWISERNEEGLVWYWHRDTRVSVFDLPPLPSG